jgi:VanZ family protein
MSAIIRWLMVVVWMSAIFILSSFSSLHVPLAHTYDFLLRKLAHIGEYGVLTALFWWTFRMYTGSRGRAWLLAAVASALYAVSDEWHQSWVVGRQGTFRDVGIDALGIVLSYSLAQLLPLQIAGSFQGITASGQCPVCQAMRVYRSRRRGRLERCSRLISLTPFRCDICGHRFWRFKPHGR